MLKGISWDALSFPGTFQNGRLEKILKIKKNGNFPISVHNYHRITMFYVYDFESVKHNEIGFEELTQNTNSQNPRWPPFFAKKVIICWGRVF